MNAREQHALGLVSELHSAADFLGPKAAWGLISEATGQRFETLDPDDPHWAAARAALDGVPEHPGLDAALTAFLAALDDIHWRITCEEPGGNWNGTLPPAIHEGPTAREWCLLRHQLADLSAALDAWAEGGPTEETVR